MLLWSKSSKQTASPEQATGKRKSSQSKKCPKQLRWEFSSCCPNFKLETPRFHSGFDRPENTQIPKLPPIPHVVWQQPLETIINQCNLSNTNNDSTIYYTQETSKTTVASQTSPPKGTQPQNYVVAVKHPPGDQSGNEPKPFLNCCKNRPTDIQNSGKNIKTTLTGDTTVPPLTTTTPPIEERLVRDVLANEVYLPLTSTVVLKRKQEMLYVPLDFENNQTVDALVDSTAYVTSIYQNDLDTKKQNAQHNILKNDDPPSFQIQAANGLVEKPLATATFTFEIGDNVFAEHFVVMMKLTKPIVELHFLKNNGVVIDTTHGLIHCPHLTRQLKLPDVKQPQNPSQSSLDDALTIPLTITKTITPFLNHPSKWNTTGTVTPLEKFTEFTSLLIVPLNVDKNWQNISSQGNQYNGITIFNQKANTDCKVLRSHSGAIKAH